MKELRGDRLMVIPDNSDETKTVGGIIIPNGASYQNNLKSGIVAKKGTGTPWNPLDDIHLKQRVYFMRGSGMVYEEKDKDGVISKYLILSYSETKFT